MDRPCFLLVLSLVESFESFGSRASRVESVVEGFLLNRVVVETGGGEEEGRLVGRTFRGMEGRASLPSSSRGRFLDGGAAGSSLGFDYTEEARLLWRGGGDLASSPR